VLKYNFFLNGMTIVAKHSNETIVTKHSIVIVLTTY